MSWQSCYKDLTEELINMLFFLLCLGRDLIRTLPEELICMFFVQCLGIAFIIALALAVEVG